MPTFMPSGSLSAEIFIAGPTSAADRSEITFDCLWTPGDGAPGSVVSSPVADEVCERIDFAFKAPLVSLFTTDWRYRGVRVRQWGNASATPTQISQIDDNLPGTQTFKTMPPALCALMRKQSPSGNRRSKGRVFLPCIAEDAVDNLGRIDNVSRGVFNDRFATALLALNGAIMPSGARGVQVVMRNSPGAGNGTEYRLSPVTSFVCDIETHWLRSRAV